MQDVKHSHHIFPSSVQSECRHKTFLPITDQILHLDPPPRSPCPFEPLHRRETKIFQKSDSKMYNSSRFANPDVTT